MPVPAHPRLAALIVTQGIPRYMVAARAGINPNTLGGILSGRVIPTAAQQQRLADALNAAPDDLFDTAVGGHQ